MGSVAYEKPCSQTPLAQSDSTGTSDRPQSSPRFSLAASIAPDQNSVWESPRPNIVSNLDSSTRTVPAKMRPSRANPKTRRKGGKASTKTEIKESSAEGTKASLR